MWLLILGLVVCIAALGIVAYNSLVRYKTYSEEAFSQIDVQLKRRNDLIPNLIETVKGYAKHEQETLDKVIQARNQLLSGGLSKEETMAVSNELSQGMKSIFALAESYPDLKANTNFLQLQEELANTENKIAYARQHYNTVTSQYNIKVQTVPTNIIAGIAGFSKLTLLETPEEEKVVPKVSF